MSKALLPIGIDTFYKLITHRDSQGNAYLFADKSLLIKTFVDAGEVITLITRPRRFGKTLNLSMLQHFFSHQVNGKPTQGLFEGLAVSCHPEVMAYQGKYPVIFLTFKAMRGRDFKTCLGVLQGVIAALFERHLYLLDGERLSEVQEARFQRFLREEAALKEYPTSLLFLSQLLYAHHGQEVIILLDEYDTPVHDAFVHDYYSDLRALLAPMLHNTFKGNSALHKAMITGILKVAQSSFFSELNNVAVHTMLGPSTYAPYFGFTQEETDKLLAQAGVPAQASPVLKEMYNGYRIKKCTLYNPFSIISFIEEALKLEPGEPLQEALKPYWVNTGGTHLMGDLLEQNLPALQESLQLLLQGKPFSTPIYEDVTFNPKCSYDDINFWSLMLLSGYVKVVGKEAPKGPLDIYQVCFPNAEVKRVMDKLLMAAVAGGASQGYRMSLAAYELGQGKIGRWVAFLEDYLRHVTSCHDTKGRYKEQFFHGLVLGLIGSLLESHQVCSNKESGQGRYDIALEPLEKSGKGVLMEFKVARHKEDDLQALATQAYQQIMDKDYAQAMQARGVQEIMGLGIAFYGQEVVVVEG